MHWQKFTDNFLKTGDVCGITIVDASSCEILASSGDSVSAADCQTVWSAVESGESSEVSLRGALHKNTMPGYEYESLSYVSVKSGVVVIFGSRAMVFGCYEEEQGQDSERCFETVKKLVAEVDRVWS